MGKIKFLKTGVYASIQDRGRYGHTDKGIPQSGPMDLHSFTLCNLLLLNKPNKSCLEFYMGGAKMQFDQMCQVVCCGANSEVLINEISHPTRRILNINAGDVLEIMHPTSGQWLYMGMAGKFSTKKILGSKSFYPHITSIAKFEKGDILKFKAANKNYKITNSGVKSFAFFEQEILPVYPGPDFEKLPLKIRHHLRETKFTLSATQSRMGIWFEEKIPNQLKEILSVPVYPGTIQLTPSGQLIALMRDAQVTGGYPRIFQLTDLSISALAQKWPGQEIRFKIVKVD